MQIARPTADAAKRTSNAACREDRVIPIAALRQTHGNRRFADWKADAGAIAPHRQDFTCCGLRGAQIAEFIVLWHARSADGGKMTIDDRSSIRRQNPVAVWRRSPEGWMRNSRITSGLPLVQCFFCVVLGESLFRDFRRNRVFTQPLPL